MYEAVVECFTHKYLRVVLVRGSRFIRSDFLMNGDTVLTLQMKSNCEAPEANEVMIVANCFDPFVAASLMWMVPTRLDHDVRRTRRKWMSHSSDDGRAWKRDSEKE